MLIIIVITDENLLESTVTICMQNFVGKALGKRIVGRPRSRCKNNIKTNSRGAGCEDQKSWTWLRFGVAGFDVSGVESCG
jgi:hypothetical protein